MVYFNTAYDDNDDDDDDDVSSVKCRNLNPCYQNKIRMITFAIISLTNHFFHQVVINEKFLTVFIIVLSILLNIHVSLSFLYVYIV